MKRSVIFHGKCLMICILALMSLSWVDEARTEAASGSQEKERAALLAKVFPTAERFETVDKGFIKYEVAYQGEERIGAAFYTEGKGYGGPMRVMVGIDPQGKVVEVILISHQETLGLWTQQVDQEFRSQFRGKSRPFILKRDDPSGNLDGVTSATVTCRAIIGAVEEALRIFKQEWGKGGK
ncbi:MAG: FMN-binding protein [candidate division NC10 bacterium]|nr:FMN-binding protein [candidate division NC10 bacterium]